MTATSVGVAVITHRARAHLERCLPPILGSPLRPRVLVVNSSSGDGTVEAARTLGAETLVIPRHEFNHGATRELARRHLATEVVVMMTPDAYARDVRTLETLVAPVLSGNAALAYGRQVPGPGAHVFEAFLRGFNYPSASHVRSLEDADAYGAYLFFCSNAFAAYLNDALDEVGGFQPTLAHEDAIAAAMLLQRGHRVAYVAEAIVEHSHRYSLGRDLKRYFDAGYARREHAGVLAIGGPHSRLGARYTQALLGELARTRPWLLPYGVASVGAKAVGYSLGSRSVGAPVALKRALSGQDYYWPERGRSRQSAAAPAARSFGGPGAGQP